MEETNKGNRELDLMYIRWQSYTVEFIEKINNNFQDTLKNCFNLLLRNRI